MNTVQALTADERELIGAFRQADSRGKRSIIEHAQSTAEDWPKPRPSLILVPNCGAQKVRAEPGKTDRHG